MEHINSLFKKTAWLSIFLIGLITLIIKGSFFSLYVFNNISQGNGLFYIYPRALDIFYSVSIATLFALVLPWLLLSFFGEWLFTRTLQRKDIFKIFFKDYFKTFLFFSVIIILITIIDSYFYQSYFSRIDLSIFSITITFYLSLLLAGNSQLLKKSLTIGFPFLLIYFFFNFIYGGNELINNSFSWLIWLVYLSIIYNITSKYNSDIDLNIPGKKDDENNAISKMTIYSKEFFETKVNLQKVVNPFNKFLSQFRLIVSQNISLNRQIILIILSISLFFMVKLNIKTSFTYPSQFLPTDLGLSLGVLVFGVIVLSAINSRYQLIKLEEFLFTRAVSRTKIYIYSFLMQGIFVFSILGLIYLILFFYSFNSSEQFISNFLEWKNIFKIVLFFYIAGELGVVSFVFILLLTLSTNNDFVSSLLFNLSSSGYISYTLFLSVILFRFWDYFYFKNKELGFFRGLKNTFKENFKIYVPTAIMIVFTICFSTIANPVTNILNINQSNKFLKTSLTFNSAIFIREGNHYDEILKNINNWSRYRYLDNEVYKNDLLRVPRFEQLFFNGLKKLQINHKDEEGYLLLASAYLNGFLSQFSPETLSIKNYEGYYSHYKNKFAQEFLKQVKLKKGTDKYIYLKALINLSEDRFDKAIDLTEELVLTNRKKEYVYLLAFLYEHEMKFDKAIEKYKLLASFEREDYSKFGEMKKVLQLYWDNKQYKEFHEYYKSQLINYRGISLGTLLRSLNYDYYSTNNCHILQDLEPLLYSTNEVRKASTELCKNNPVIAENLNFNKVSWGAKRVAENELNSWYLDQGIYNKLHKYRGLNKSEKNAYHSFRQGDFDKAKSFLKLTKIDNFKTNANNFLTNKTSFKYYYYLTKYNLSDDISQKIKLAEKVIFTNEEGDLNGIILDSLGLKSLKIDYDLFYSYLESLGHNNISQNRSVERSLYLLNRYKGLNNDYISVEKMNDLFSKIETVFNLDRS